MQGQDFLVPFGGAGHPGDCQKELAQQRETKVSEHSEKGLALFRHLDGRASGTGSSRGVAEPMIGFSRGGETHQVAAWGRQKMKCSIYPSD
jgi:hypothetical protein